MTPPGYRTPAERVAALRKACRSIDLDSAEDRLLEWLSIMLDGIRAETFASLLEKIREAGYLTYAEEKAARFQEMADEPRPGLIIIQAPGFVAGNSGPGF
jgi:hypothetical protein